MSARDWQKDRNRQRLHDSESAARVEAAQKRYAEVKGISLKSPRSKNWHGPSKLSRSLEQRKIESFINQDS